MKAKFTAAVILSAILLTACNSETSLIDDIETSGTTASAQDIQAVQEGTNPAENEDGTNYILGGETETAVSAAETVIETLPPKIENISENVTLDIEAIDISSILSGGQNYSRLFFLGNIAMIGTSDRKGEVCFFDTNDRTLKSKITPPEGWEFDWNYHCIKGSGDILCKIQLLRFDSERSENDYAVITVRSDFTTELTEGEPQEIFSFPAGSHNISDHSYDIFDADSGEVIVEGFDDSETASGFGNMSLWYDYNFQIDNDRFVYRTCGIEWMPGFGYYDFTAGKAADFPDSKDFQPIGYHNGKIYAEETCWDGNCQGELYTFDVETLEKKHFMSSLAEFETDTDFSEYMEYSMSPNGEYIAAVHRKYNSGDPAASATTFYIISPDSGEALAKCEFNSSGIYYDVGFINDYCFAVKSGSSEIIIFDVILITN